MTLKNTLSEAHSPYLLQHADNPVAWQVWSDETLAYAREAGLPILLSIGYSACHWCHVMAHESFEDDATAEVMNRLFVNIEVDREERPDLDKVYQLAHQIIARRAGGWPLTVFLDPATLAPFFAGTYFPREPRYGMPPFRHVLEQASAYYHTHADDIAAQRKELIALLQRADGDRDSRGAAGEARLDAAPLDMARHQITHQFDADEGGFGGAPKFPHPGHIERLMRYWAESRNAGRDDADALRMACFSLERMAASGLFDHVGGGFFRYAVDGAWEIPHFEKMLYDNAQLLPLYVQAGVVTGDPVYTRAARETVDWLLREMRSPEGGFYSTLDADNPNGEGAYYVWHKDEVRELLGDDYAEFASCYGMNRPPNFENHWHLRRRGEPNAAHEIMARCRDRLMARRAQRTAPGLDDKVLPSWNGLMIRGLSIAARHGLGEDCLEAAEGAVRCIREHMWKDGRLFAAMRDGHVHLRAYLDDYVNLIDALVELLQVRWNAEYCAFACELAASVLGHFADRERGGFYFTADDHEALIHRAKPFVDDAMPAGNGVAARALGRLGHLTGNNAYLDAASGVLKAAWTELTDVPYAHDILLTALEEQIAPPQTIVIRGAGSELDAWHKAALAGYAPRRMVVAIPNDAEDLPKVLADYLPAAQGCVAYCCSGLQCEPPIHDLDALCARLEQPL
ncbi:MAG: DUF255 domain-containing protein [Gammaproteobacteria bacterium]|nr:DUF255 domain-containing protein [Gammaproteobacteria bacterium]